MRQSERGRFQNERKIIIDTHKCPHRQSSNQKHPQECDFIQEPSHIPYSLTHIDGRRSKVLRTWNLTDKDNAKYQADKSDRQCSIPPVAPSGKERPHHPACHPADRIPAQIKADCQTDHRSVHLFRQISKCDSRYPGKHSPLQKVYDQ